MILTEDKEIIQKNLSKTLPEIVILLNKKYTKKEIKNYCDNHNLRYKHLSSHERSEIQKSKIMTKQREQTLVNYNYFKTWSKNMAYIFGLWCADGCIYSQNKGYYWCITLKEDDKYLLKQIDEEMQGQHKLYKNRHCYSLMFSCKTIYQDIVMLGGKETKSLTLQFPNIPEQYLSHFIRGYFDGDGSVSQRGNSGYLIGTYEFCEQLNVVLKRNGINISSIKEKHPELCSNTYCLNIFKKEEFRKFSEFIYSDMDENSLYLYRKRNRNTTISQEKTFFTRSNSPQRA